MDEAADLEQLLQRLMEGTVGESERQALKEALAAGRLSLATGTRAMAVGGSVTDTVIVIGDRNIVFKGGDAAALRQAFLALYPSRLRQLPADLPDFTGRGPEVERLLHLFLDGAGQAAISALGGMGGVGKTALAVHVAHKLAVHYPEAQIVVELKGTSEAPLSPAAAMGQVIIAFEPQARLPEETSEVAALYRSLLAGRWALLLLDNAANATQVRDLLPDPPAAALITSRRTIVLPGLTTLKLDVLSEAEAAHLLRAILGPERVADEEIAALVAHCGRLPLALRAAGTFLEGHPDWTPGEYLEALAQEKKRLRRLKHEDLEVEAPLGLSAAQLVREDHGMAGHWQMLSVFPRNFDRAVAAAVWQVEIEEARDILSELLARSLVLHEPGTGRYHLHDLMRLVAQNAFGYGEAVPDAAADQERLARAAARHAAHFLEILRVANALSLIGGEFLAHGLRLFDLEWDNIRAGQKWAAAQAEADEAAARLCNDYPDAGFYLLMLRQHPRERIAWLTAALAAAKRLKDRAAEGHHLGNLGQVYGALGEYRRTIYFCEQHLTISREIGDRWGEEAALGNLGNAYNFLGEYRWAIEHYEQVLAIAREIGDRRGEGNVLSNLGSACSSLREYRRAIEFYEQALAISREVGDRRGEGNTLWNMSLTLDKLGKRQEAISAAERALEISGQIEEPAAAKMRLQLEKWRREG